MWKMMTLAVLESLLLCAEQVFLKYALMRMPPFGWTRTFWISLLTNWQFALCGVLFVVASVLWMYLLKVLPFSVAYPMVSLSYVFGMIAAVLFFHEDVSMTRWMGALLIVLGCVFLAK